MVPRLPKVAHLSLSPLLFSRLPRVAFSISLVVEHPQKTLLMNHLNSPLSDMVCIFLCLWPFQRRTDSPGNDSQSDVQTRNKPTKISYRSPITQWTANHDLRKCMDGIPKTVWLLNRKTEANNLTLELPQPGVWQGTERLSCNVQFSRVDFSTFDDSGLGAVGTTL